MKPRALQPYTTRTGATFK